MIDGPANMGISEINHARSLSLRGSVKSGYEE
jgi:hypothetical protein